MSDYGSERASFEALSAGTGFRSDARFVSLGAPPQIEPELHPAPPAQPEDPLAIAFSEGYTAGVTEAQAHAAQLAQADTTAREGLSLAFARLDATLEDQLRERLRETVAALCEAAIAPMALDGEVLAQRIDRALAMFSRADDERIIRLHPDDIAMLAPQFAADWQIVPDRTLERGALRVETESGGVEDGPDLWRRAIAEALHQC